jgi:PAS domain S-box-containing protein
MPRSAHHATPVEAHLEALLERVPVCLTRVAHDGTFLAVNDAALVLLGGESLGQVLGKTLQSFLVRDDRDACRRFVERVATGERASMEVELTNLTGTLSIVQINGTPISEAPDGLKSALLAYRDVSEQRRLEQSLVDAAPHKASDQNVGEGLSSAIARIEDLEHALQQSEARRVELEALLGERDGISIDLDAVAESGPAGGARRKTKG